MNDIIEVYNEYEQLGIKTRKITQGVEFNLVKQFINYKKDSFKYSSTNKLAVFIEPKINNAYPDIVFVKYNPENYNNWNKERRDLSVIDYKILYHIFIRKQLDATSIVNQLGVSWKDVMLSIEKLFDSKFIIRKNNYWCIRSSKIFSVKNIEAVEAKINKLDEVFQQALINKNFASESYVLSNMSKGIKTDKLVRFSKFGIGVYASNAKSFKIINKSSKTSIPVSFSSIFFNEWVGKILMDEGGNI